MANLEETEIWEDGIYQFEETDFIEGGANGIDNLPHKQLGARTKFLKAKIGELEVDISNITTNNYTKTEIDTLLQGLKPKASVKVATTMNITLSDTQTIDSIAVAVGDRVLVKDQTTASQNGIYIVSASTWTRSLDSNTAVEITGAFVFVEQGTTNADTAWVQTADNITLGSTNLVWVKFAGNGAFQAASTILTAIAALTSGVGYLNFNNGVVSISDAAPKIMIIEDQKAYNVAGGTSVVGINIRTLNTVVANTIEGASLASNQITVPAGTYLIEASSPAYLTGHRLLLNNITANTYIPGTLETSYTNNFSLSQSSVKTIVTFDETTTLQLAHDITRAVATYGLGGLGTGVLSNDSANVFSRVTIQQIIGA